MPQHDPSGAIVGSFFAVWGLVALIGLALTVFWIVEIVDVLRREFRDPTLKIVWLLVVVLLHGLGAIIYYFVGKPQGRLPGEGGLPPASY